MVRTRPDCFAAPASGYAPSSGRTACGHGPWPSRNSAMTRRKPSSSGASGASGARGWLTALRRCEPASPRPARQCGHIAANQPDPRWRAPTGLCKAPRACAGSRRPIRRFGSQSDGAVAHERHDGRYHPEGARAPAGESGSRGERGAPRGERAAPWDQPREHTAGHPRRRLRRWVWLSQRGSALAGSCCW